MRRLFGVMLVLIALSVSVPFLPRAVAYLSSTITLPAANQARYRTVGPTGTKFLMCSVPTAIVLQKNKSTPLPHFSCENNFNTAVQLDWEVVNANGSGISIPAGTFSTLGANSNGCQTVTITTPNNNANNRLVTFRGVTSTAAALYAEIYFTGTVSVQNGSAGLQNGCP
ncbi:MAG TPA: hypothetical protein VD902_18035 [Symbiobacteriaceae bacterium]|nr:hypothetical protein [Symbiobacteriaceae bacterium]